MLNKENLRFYLFNSKGQRLLIATILLSVIIPVPSQVFGNSRLPSVNKPDHEQAIRTAGQSVDEAWETFHQAALGGTLASPKLQTRVEFNLHEARNLLLQLRQDVERGDLQEVQFTIERLRKLTGEAIQLSQEKKK